VQVDPIGREAAGQRPGISNLPSGCVIASLAGPSAAGGHRQAADALIHAASLPFCFLHPRPPAPRPQILPLASAATHHSHATGPFGHGVGSRFGLLKGAPPLHHHRPECHTSSPRRAPPWGTPAAPRRLSPPSRAEVTVHQAVAPVVDRRCCCDRPSVPRRLAMELAAWATSRFIPATEDIPHPVAAFTPIVPTDQRRRIPADAVHHLAARAVALNGGVGTAQHHQRVGQRLCRRSSGLGTVRHREKGKQPQHDPPDAVADPGVTGPWGSWPGQGSATVVATRIENPRPNRRRKHGPAATQPGPPPPAAPAVRSKLLSFCGHWR